MIESGQTAGRGGAQFFQGHVGGGDLNEGRHIAQQHDNGLTGGIVYRRRCRIRCGGDSVRRCDGVGGRLSTQCQPPITGNDGTHQKKTGQTHGDSAVHHGSPFPAA
eukprot:c28696_g1_i1.p1 GENE.c28696_g1_i1~~c28696_g1_i1.p1  ORF type:complete len:106 (-),score=2.52 c28696_g1_i1:79-396(-)